MENIESAPKEVLVDIVKMSQKRGMKGSSGDWKEFLSVHDKKLGKSLSDPAKRSPDDLIAFLKTFTDADHLRFFGKVAEKHDCAEVIEKGTGKISPEQELVLKTIAHPHYALAYSFPSHEEGWVVTKNRKKLKEMRSNTIIAVDCEMVLCDDGNDALVRVCVVDRDLNVLLDELVKPDRPVVDYRSHITAICAEDLENVTTTLQDIQESMKKLLSRGTILIGHSLNSDLKALKIDHTRVIDTSLCFKYWSGAIFKRISLNNLCKMVLGNEVRKDGDTHDCLDDAKAAMKLVVAKLNGKIDDIALPSLLNEADEANAMKLLCHRIPISIAKEKLVEIIPGEFTVESKANRKGGDKYSALLVFKNKQEADEAFQRLVGDQRKDSSGRPQKLISFKLASGASGDLYVRKMSPDGDDDDNDVQVTSNKRPSEEENSTQPKKLKTQGETAEPKVSVGCFKCDSYLNEIEILKKQLHEREQEISMLNKIIVSQARKQFGV